MGGLINAFLNRRWLTIAGVVLVIVGVLQPSKGLADVLVALGLTLMVVQTIIRVTVIQRAKREAKASKATR